jgi:hypothetical protein
MAKIKNTGKAPRGFIDDQGAQHTVHPGEEAEVNMTEADYEKLEELLKKEKEANEEAAKANPEAEKVPPSFELSGGAGGKAQSGATISATGNRVETPKAEEKPAKK